MGFVACSLRADSDSQYTQPKGDNTGVKIADIVPRGRYYRHPDSSTISYADVVREPLGEIEKSKDLDIAIVGAGPAGIVSLFELARLVEAGKCGNICVTLYDSDPEHFTYGMNIPSTKEEAMNRFRPVPYMVDVQGHKAGRVFAARNYHPGENAHSHSVYEIGAMRFPEIAGLTWHYASMVFKPDDTVKQFPNPGSVPSELVFGDRVDRYLQTSFLDQSSPVEKAVHIVQQGIVGNLQGDNISLYQIGGKDPAKVSEELKSDKTTEARLVEIRRQWKEFIETHDKLTLATVVREVIENKIKDLPHIPGIIDEQARINYYFELIGVFGFGTGGFRPLYGAGFVEMMRLFLWSYNNEYSLPVEENFQFIRKLFEKCLEISQAHTNFNIVFKHQRVTDVCHDCDNGKALVFAYPFATRDGMTDEEDFTPSGPTTSESFDYSILATTPQQLANIVARTGYSNKAHLVKMGNYGHQCSEPTLAKNPLVLSTKEETPNMQMYTAIRNVNMVNSSKVFATIKKSVYEKWAPKFKLPGDEREHQVRAFVTDTGLGSGYAIDSNVNENFISFLISYNWECDTKRLQHHYRVLPTNALDIKTSSMARQATPKEHELMVNAIVNYTERDVKEPSQNGKYKRWWLAEMLSDKENGKSVLMDTLSYDWNTSPTGGAFKLDLPGSSYNSALCMRFHTHALNKELNNRFFLAGCSFSHLGGWLEGAFMTAVNAVTGLIVAANGGGKEALAKLTPEARKVMEGFEPIAPYHNLTN